MTATPLVLLHRARRAMIRLGADLRWVVLAGPDDAADDAPPVRGYLAGPDDAADDAPPVRGYLADPWSSAATAADSYGWDVVQRATFPPREDPPPEGGTQ